MWILTNFVFGLIAWARACANVPFFRLVFTSSQFFQRLSLTFLKAASAVAEKHRNFACFPSLMRPVILSAHVWQLLANGQECPAGREKDRVSFPSFAFPLGNENGRGLICIFCWVLKYEGFGCFSQRLPISHIFWRASFFCLEGYGSGGAGRTLQVGMCRLQMAEW